MAEIVQTVDAFTVVAPPLRLAFRWDGARWRHELDIDGRTVASSLEWEPERDDPTRVVSPSYQQFSVQDEPGEIRALLVGQWGRHHGSAVFAVRDAESGVVVEVDVAVRSRGPLHSLASTYLARLNSSDLFEADPRAIVWNLEPPPGGRLRFEPVGEAEPTTRVLLAEAGRGATRVQAVAEIVPASANHRLRYRWCWRPGENAP